MDECQELLAGPVKSDSSSIEENDSQKSPILSESPLKSDVLCETCSIIFSKKEADFKSTLQEVLRVSQNRLQEEKMANVKKLQEEKEANEERLKQEREANEERLQQEKLANESGCSKRKKQTQCILLSLKIISRDCSKRKKPTL